MSLMLAVYACSNEDGQSPMETDGGMNIGVDVTAPMDGDLRANDAGVNDPDSMVINIPMRPRTSGLINPVLIPKPTPI